MPMSAVEMYSGQRFLVTFVLVFLLSTRIIRSEDLHDDCATPHSNHENRWLLGEQAEIEYFGRTVRYV